MAAKKSTPPAVFDVSKPKSGAPPLIAKRTVIKLSNDPDTEANAETVPDAPAKRTKEVVIKPIHESLKADITLAEVEPAPSTEPTETETISAPVASQPTKQQTVVNTEPVKTAAEPPKGFPEPIDDAAVKPEDQPGVPGDKAEREADDEIARKRAARLQKMIEEEEYFLPIQTVEERRSRRVAIFGVLLIIILAAAWYNAALDANLLPNTYNLPHTSFFTVK